MTSQNERHTYWRSLGELEQSPAFEQFLHREFPVGASEYPRGVSRRRWLQLMGASFALAGMAGCRRWDAENFAPHATRPENRDPGETQQYATSIFWGGAPRHLLATCYDGRPIKLEGNPEHPASRGASDRYSQAAILDLYDPDRSGAVRERTDGQVMTRDWDDFAQFARDHFAALRDNGGAELGLLLEPTESLVVQRAVARWREAFPNARICEYTPVSRSNEQEGARLAFGQPLRAHLHLGKAQVLVVLDGDLLQDHPDALAHARDFIATRDPESGTMSRLYVVESQVSTTGAMADHRWPVASHRIPAWLSRLEQHVEQQLSGAESNDNSADAEEQRLRVVAKDLVAHRGAGLVWAGPRQPPEVHARLHRLNVQLGNVGSVVTYSALPATEKTVTIAELAAAIEAGEVKTLILTAGNPVYDAPADLDFAAMLRNVPHTIRLGLYEDETSRECTWHLPLAHPLEHWDALRAYDGCISLGQPLIKPLLNGRSAAHVLQLCLGDAAQDDPTATRAAVEAQVSDLDDKSWSRLVHDGFLSGTQYAALTPKLSGELPASTAPDSEAEEKLEVVFTPSDTVYDGRFANNGWLQETPALLTKLTWDNAALLHPATAAELGLKQGQMLLVEHAGRQLRVPAYLLPGQARRSIGIALGYGRTAAGHVGGLVDEGVTSVGFNAYALRTSTSPWVATGVHLTPLDETYDLATTQEHHAIDRLGLEEIGHRVGQLVREATLEHYREHPDFAAHAVHHPPLESLWKEPSYEGRAWGMAIDLNKCIGCNACMVACQAENNVPVVGKEQVLRGREMHWIRVDRYFHGDVDQPEVVTQPVACQQCENAPCEQVCPVAATVHSSEGLNDMVYNRCIGTRYCANNCPYKVRRFNYFDFNEQLSAPGRELVQLVVNPEVSVRSRGVMEKCTYCVQRIQAVKIDAKNDRRAIGDGEIRTACQQVCPTRAIDFGDLHQSGSRVAAAHANPRAYGMLAELNVKPRTKYLARIRNPHPELIEAEAPAEPARDTERNSHERHG